MLAAGCQTDLSQNGYGPSPPFFSFVGRWKRIRTYSENTHTKQKQTHITHERVTNAHALASAGRKHPANLGTHLALLGSALRTRRMRGQRRRAMMVPGTASHGRIEHAMRRRLRNNVTLERMQNIRNEFAIKLYACAGIYHN